MNYIEAQNLYRQHYTYPCKKRQDIIFPYPSTFNDQQFVLINIPISDLYITNDVYDKKVNEYTNIIENDGYFNPIWISYGKLLKDGSINPPNNYKCNILHGNNRVEAHRINNVRQLEAYIPQNMYKVYTQRGL